ncbi:amidohydrolase family protein [Dyella halodurans]|uniref:Amidohydrolase family protein n=1 Tax=Dyella halodurans TaxID=1920171 RepID=A0ABV9C3B0_9GAMM
MPNASTSLCHAGTITPEGVSREPLMIRHGHVATSLAAWGYRVDLRDHLIFPGLINAHDHLHVNAVPPLNAGAPFPNSYAWIEAFRPHFEEPEVSAALQWPKPLRLRHGGLKNLLAGATCVAHHDPWHPVLDAADFPVALLRDFGWSYALGWPGYGPPVRESFLATAVERPWMIHLAEGTDATAQAELAALDQLGCLAANSVLIHGVGLREQDIARIMVTGAAVVWCPASNLALLGKTLAPRRLFDAGRLALGTDSRLSGSRDLLEEMRCAMALGDLAPAQLVDMATTHAARILRLPQHGSLAPGARADMVIVEDRGGDEANSLAGIQRSEIRAVIRDGVPRMADHDFVEWFQAAGVDTVSVILDGKPKLLAQSLADPALIAMEPGLELATCCQARTSGLTVEAHCR